MTRSKFYLVAAVVGALVLLSLPQKLILAQEEGEAKEEAPKVAIEVEEPKFVEAFDGGAIDLKVFPEIIRPQGVEVRVEDGWLVMRGKAPKGQSIVANVATPPLSVQPFEISVKVLLPKLPFGAMCGIYISNATPKGEETSNGVAVDMSSGFAKTSVGEMLQQEQDCCLVMRLKSPTSSKSFLMGRKGLLRLWMVCHWGTRKQTCKMKGLR